MLYLSGLVYCKYDYDTKEWLSPVSDIEFTHWMPLPKLPKLSKLSKLQK